MKYHTQHKRTINAEQQGGRSQWFICMHDILKISLTKRETRKDRLANPTLDQKPATSLLVRPLLIFKLKKNDRYLFDDMNHHEPVWRTLLSGQENNG